jgi:uncharacterized protein (DUF1501 family)
MAQSRRDFLRNTGCALGSLALASTVDTLGLVNAYAQSAADYRALVCIFLSGGNDCNNMVVDLNQFNSYNTVRGASGLAIPQANLLQISPLSGGSYGLHPMLPELRTLFNQSSSPLAIVANVGPLVEPLTRVTYQNGTGKKPLQLFSHSDQVGLWQSGVGNDVVQTGWGGRIADKTGSLNGIATFPQMTSIAGVSLFVTGATARPLAIGDSNTALNAVLPLSNPPGSAGFTGAQNTARRTAFDQINLLDPGVTLIKASESVRSSALQTQAALASVNPALSTAFPNTTLGRQLLQVARVIKASTDPVAGINMKRQIFFCNLGGFDTNSVQTSATFTGAQGNLLQQLSQAMNAFYAATVELNLAPNVTTFTLSDFGRTLSPSGSGVAAVGSDHGWGNHHFVMGGSVIGSRLYGTYPTLALSGPDDTDSRGRWIPTTAVEQYGATLANWYGLSSSDFPAVFPLLSHFSPTIMPFMM